MAPPQHAGQPVFTCFNSTFQTGEGRSEARAIFSVGAQASHCVLQLRVRHPLQPVHREFPCCSLQRSREHVSVNQTATEQQVWPILWGRDKSPRDFLLYICDPACLGDQNQRRCNRYLCLLRNSITSTSLDNHHSG